MTLACLAEGALLVLQSTCTGAGEGSVDVEQVLQQLAERFPAALQPLTQRRAWAWVQSLGRVHPVPKSHRAAAEKAAAAAAAAETRAAVGTPAARAGPGAGAGPGHVGTQETQAHQPASGPGTIIHTPAPVARALAPGQSPAVAGGTQQPAGAAGRAFSHNPAPAGPTPQPARPAQQGPPQEKPVELEAARREARSAALAFLRSLLQCWSPGGAGSEGPAWPDRGRQWAARVLPALQVLLRPACLDLALAQLVLPEYQAMVLAEAEYRQLAGQGQLSQLGTAGATVQDAVGSGASGSSSTTEQLPEPRDKDFGWAFWDNAVPVGQVRLCC